MFNFTQTTYIEIKINKVTFSLRDKNNTLIWTETLGLYNLKTTDTNIKAVYESRCHSLVSY